MTPITAFYAALVTILFVALSLAVIRLRRGRRVSMGDAGDRALQRRIRAQANCAEYAPIGLLLLALLELNGTAPILLHAVGLSLLAGRLLHGWGFGRDDMFMAARVPGMLLTVGSIALAAILLLIGLV